MITKYKKQNAQQSIKKQVANVDHKDDKCTGNFQYNTIQYKNKIRLVLL